MALATAGRALTWRIALGASVSGAWWVALPFPAPGMDPLVDLVAFRSPTLLTWFRVWYYAGPAVAAIGGAMVAGTMWRVWIGRGDVAEEHGGRLPSWPTDPADPSPALVIGEVHHPVRPKPSPDPKWLVIPARGLFTGIAVFGAVGSGKTAACMKAFATQPFGWRADDPARRMAGLVLEVKGDFCHQVRDILKTAGREEDYLEIGLDSPWRWNPLGDAELDSFSLAYGVAGLMNQLYGKSKDPFWQITSMNLVRWLIELHRLYGRGWVTLQDVYRCAIDKDLFAARLAQVEDEVQGERVGVTIPARDLLKHRDALASWSWTEAAGKRMRAACGEELEQKLEELEVPFEWVRAKGAVGQELRDKVAAIRLWYDKDWQEIDKKLRTSVVETISSFLGLFDDPAVARVFCPEAPPKEPRTVAAVPPPKEDPEALLTASSAPLLRQALPPLETLIERGTVLALNMPVGSNPALSRAIGVLLKMCWLQAVIRRPARMAANPGWEPRPAVFLCDEYQQFATVGEDEANGDEKAFSLTRQSRLIPIVATQSISSLRSVLGQSEAWRTLLQTLRSRIYLSQADDQSAKIASDLCGQVSRMHESWTVSENMDRAGVNFLTGGTGGAKATAGINKSFQDRKEALFSAREFTVLENYSGIAQIFDGKVVHDATRVYLKPDYVDADLTYWRAREAGKL